MKNIVKVIKEIGFPVTIQNKGGGASIQSLKLNLGAKEQVKIGWEGCLQETNSEAQ